jgi:hypothetical protein
MPIPRFKGRRNVTTAVARAIAADQKVARLI